ncbi:MAG: hypothetical protein ABR567_01930 [Myxococcales bacterium]|nr:hypothetical protein [Myxococcales bacterium]
MIAIFAAAWFSAVQYTPRPVSLRGCAECKGEPDDVCEVRAGAQAQPIDEYPRPAGGRIKLLRPSAETACAVPAQKITGSRGALELAAVRMASGPPSAALLEAVHLKPPIRGWPQRKSAPAIAATPDRSSLRLSVLCWPSDRGWPNGALGAANSCEWWLLAVDASGQPDLAGASFALTEPPFAAGSKWPTAFDRNAPLAESLFVGTPSPTVSPPAKVVESGRVHCRDGARERTATLDRFDQWDQQIRGDSQPSLDRASLTLRSALWSGHCQEMDVLRTALERQLECTLAVEGRCE